MSRIIAELTVRPRSSPPASSVVPRELARYATGFLATGRDSLRFLWRDGERWLSVHLVRSGSGVGQPGDRATLRVAEIELPRGITVREVDVLTLLALGLTNSGIADRLGTSARTVSTQIERLLTKLDQESRGGLSAIAVDSGMLRMPIPGGVDGASGIGIVELEAAVTRPDGSGARTPLRPAYSRKRPLQLGTLIPAGIVAADGREFLNGGRLAIDELNTGGGVGGRTVELVAVEADIFDGAAVERALGTLFDHDVDAITTSYASAEHPRILDLVADYGRPFLHTATFAEQVELTEADPSRYGAVFQTCASETHYGAGLLRLLDQLEQRRSWRPHSRRIASVEAATTSTRVTSAGFRDEAAAIGWDVEDPIRVPIGRTDWADVVARLQRSAPSVVMVAHFIDSELAEFQRRFAAAGIPALVYCIYGASIPDFHDAVGAAADGVVWSTTTGTYDDVLGRRFRDQYASRFGTMPGWSQAGAAYDHVRLLAAAWSATASRDTADVVRYLRSWPHRGVNGVYYFRERKNTPVSYPDVTPDASIGQAHMIYQIQSGAHRVLAPEPFGSAAAFRAPSWWPVAGEAKGA